MGKDELVVLKMDIEEWARQEMDRNEWFRQRIDREDWIQCKMNREDWIRMAKVTQASKDMGEPSPFPDDSRSYSIVRFGANLSDLEDVGIVQMSGDVITEGKVVDIAREAYKLLQNEDAEGFVEYYGRMKEELNLG